LRRRRVGADWVAGASHLTPSLAIFFVPEVASATGRDVHLAATRGNGDGNDVPKIFRDDVSDDEVDFLCGIYGRGLEFDNVAGAVIVPGGLDLDTPEPLAGIEDEVIALAVSPGFRDTETETGDFGKECGFGGFAERLGAGEADSVDFRND
jgi:hypothetical protein